MRDACYKGIIETLFHFSVIVVLFYKAFLLFSHLFPIV
ncbi:hypothetical protein EDC54_1045 [Samsonia erythrinae]|uniref:Uncharacterized protein n=1 Tax=Samsonia erythrinae TaxID=160434 RepID=A0A4V2VTD1_9GAMM|nr:hypothetical protein EDC54_1045 [Samsonia erythrinae]